MIFVVDIDGSGADAWLSACDAEPEITFPLGVFAATNPVRATGKYYFPDEVKEHCTLVSAEGLRHTDPAYLDRAILPFADWRRARQPRVWLDSLYTTLLDASLRGYPLWLADSEAAQDEPDTQAASLANWMGRELNALHLVLPPRAARSEASDVLDEFRQRLARRDVVDDDFVDRLAAAHEVLGRERTDRI